MTWTRLDDGIFDHPKMLRAGDDAAHLYVRALVYCNRLLTDGRVHPEALPVIFRHRAVRDLAARLVSVGAWDVHPEGGWTVHDFHDLNPTADEVRAKRDDIRAKRSAAGKQGGIASGKARSNEANPKQPTSKPEAKPEQPDEANTKPRPVPSRPVPKTEDRQVDEPATTPDASGAVAPLSLIPSEAPKADPIVEVFAHWQRATGKERAKLDPKRRTLIARALKGRTVAELCRCVDGYAADPWHRGENDRGKGYLDLSLMLRDAEHIEKGQELPVGTTPPRPPGAPPVPAPASGRPSPRPADYDRPRGPVVPLSELAKYRDALKIARGEVPA